jgi:hypothetical protein
MKRPPQGGFSIFTGRKIMYEQAVNQQKQFFNKVGGSPSA